MTKKAVGTPQRHVQFSGKRIVLLLLSLALLYGILPELGRFRDSLDVLQRAHSSWLLLACAATAGTYVAAAGMYLLLAKRWLPPGPTLLVQLAGMFANRLLPAGIGAIGVNYRYLRRHKHTASQAGAVVATNNMLGIVGHVLLLGMLLLFVHARLKPVHFPHISGLVYSVIAVLILAACFFLAQRKIRRRFWQAAQRILSTMAEYRSQPFRIGVALLCSMLLTSLYALCLYACTQALGIHVSLPVLFIILTIGVAGATATPTPGGLGGAEAGLVAGLLLYGVNASNSLAVALLYRFFTYWLALVVGGIAFAVVERTGSI